jgi:hypothetical protein
VGSRVALRPPLLLRGLHRQLAVNVGKQHTAGGGRRAKAPPTHVAASCGQSAATTYGQALAGRIIARVRKRPGAP